MKIESLLHCAKVSAASVLIVGLSFAQSSQTTTARKSGSTVVTDSQSAHDANSGMTTGRRQYSPTIQTIDSKHPTHATDSTQRKNGAINSADFPRSTNSRNSVHAAEFPNQPAGAAKGENPLYEDSGKSGTNPLYEPKDRTINLADTAADASRKHTAGMKYQNRAAAGVAGHTSSKDTETFKQDFGQVQANKR